MKVWIVLFDDGEYGHAVYGGINAKTGRVKPWSGAGVFATKKAAKAAAKMMNLGRGGYVFGGAVVAEADVVGS